MKYCMLGLLLTAASPVSAQPTNDPDGPPPVPQSSSSVEGWSGAFEISASPAFGEPINTGVDDDPIDDSEYEALIRFRRPLHRLGGVRLQLQAGVTSTPEILEGAEDEERESSIYGEVQLGDTFIPFRELRRRNFRIKAEDNDIAAWRPFIRYRLASVNEGTFGSHLRTDHTFTAGMRYRRIPFVVGDGTEPGLYYELRAQVTRVWSSAPGEEHWNPRIQADVYSQPFWGGTRFVFISTVEANLFRNVRVPNTDGTEPGDRRVEPRVRIHAGFDLSRPLQRWLGFPDVDLQLLGRFQHRFSNDEAREHTRLYFVPSFTLTVPLRR